MVPLQYNLCEHRQGRGWRQPGPIQYFDSWWSLMILDDPWWSLMILDGPQDPSGSESGWKWVEDSESELKMGDWLARIINPDHPRVKTLFLTKKSKFWNCPKKTSGDGLGVVWGWFGGGLIRPDQGNLVAKKGPQQFKSNLVVLLLRLGVQRLILPLFASH